MPRAEKLVPMFTKCSNFIEVSSNKKKTASEEFSFNHFLHHYEKKWGSLVAFEKGDLDYGSDWEHQYLFSGEGFHAIRIKL
jgi:hypothetical protein